VVRAPPGLPKAGQQAHAGATNIVPGTLHVSVMSREVSREVSRDKHSEANSSSQNTRKKAEARKKAEELNSQQPEHVTPIEPF
jgi:hypothetical protein